MVWHILRYWISFFIPSFYKRLQANHLGYIKTKGPLIIAMNHPNAFTDPILITTLVHPLKLKFMARGDVFKPGFMASFLESIGIVPIFRIQDGGKEGLKKNEDAYRRVNYLLSKNSKIIVFAEGLCVQERRLRPLKKGVARMVFGAYEAIQDERLAVVPVGVNYSNPSKFRSDVFYNIGKPIPVKDYMDEYKKNPARANKVFIDELEPKLRSLITHINDPANDTAVLQAEILYKRKMLLEQGMNPHNLEHDFLTLQTLTEKMNTAAEQQPERFLEFKQKAQIYFDSLELHNMRDWLFDPTRKTKKNAPALLRRLITLAVGFPLYAFAMVGNYLPFRFTSTITNKIVKNIEFFSSFAIGIAMVLFLVTYMVWFILSYILFSNVLVSFTLLFVFALSAWFSLHYVPFAKRSRGIFNFVRNKQTVSELSNERAELIAIINKF